jgi:hypothetical protein
MGKPLRFEVVTVTTKNLSGVLVDMKPCISVDIQQSIGGAYLLHVQGRIVTLKTEAAKSFETRLQIYQTTHVISKKSVTFQKSSQNPSKQN